MNEEEEPQSPDSDSEEEIDWAALEELVLRNITQRVTTMMKKVMQQMRSGEYFLNDPC